MSETVNVGVCVHIVNNAKNGDLERRPSDKQKHQNCRVATRAGENEVT